MVFLHHLSGSFLRRYPFQRKLILLNIPAEGPSIPVDETITKLVTATLTKSENFLFHNIIPQNLPRIFFWDGAQGLISYPSGIKFNWLKKAGFHKIFFSFVEPK